METPSEIWDTVERIIASGAKLSIAVTGGGSVAISWLVNHPGASKAFIEAHVPYQVEALEDFLQLSQSLPANAETARLMAHQSYRRLTKFCSNSDSDSEDRKSNLVGVGCTAALTTTRKRRGEDRAFISLRKNDAYEIVSLSFSKGASDRIEQEEVLSRELIALLRRNCDLPMVETLKKAHLYKDVEFTCLPAIVELEALFRGESEVVAWNPPGLATGIEPVNATQLDRHMLLPGSFNPQHEGHLGLARAAGELSGRQTSFELSVANVDKGTLTYSDVVARLEALSLPIYVTNAPTFLEKAKKFPGCYFAIGIDTAVRLLDPRYYGENQEALMAALAEFDTYSCRFYVAGRLDDSAFATIRDLNVPQQFEHLFVEIPEELFRLDVSSTSIRANKL
tara:strand:- start:180 stop:1364 length:1185 start_codon:yes stop_codon:yes gene_type:complete